mgnify:CR=1 FL=1
MTDFDPWEDDAAIDFATEPEPALQDLDQIDRHGRRLARATAELADFDRIAAAEHADMVDRQERNRRPLVEKVGWLTRTLELAHQAIIAEDPTRTRVTLPNVTLASKAGTCEWVFADPKADPDGYRMMMDALQRMNPAVIRSPKIPEAEPDKNAIKAWVKAQTVTKVYGDTVPAAEGAVVTPDGEVIPGVHVIARPRTYKPEVTA